MTQPLELKESYSSPRRFSTKSLINHILNEENKTKEVGVLNMGTVFSGIGTPEYSLNRGGVEA